MYMYMNTAMGYVVIMLADVREGCSCSPGFQRLGSRPEDHVCFSHGPAEVRY